MESIQSVNLVNGINARRKATMHAQEFIGYHGSNGQKVKSRHKSVVSFNVTILLKAFIIETVVFGCRSALVVASEKGNIVGVFDLQGKQI